MTAGRHRPVLRDEIARTVGRSRMVQAGAPAQVMGGHDLAKGFDFPEAPALVVAGVERIAAVERWIGVLEPL